MLVYQLSRSTVQQLNFDLADFDSITMELPSGLYTTFRTYADRTRVIGLRAHLDRLYLPAKVLGMNVVLNQGLLKERLADLLKSLAPHEARLRLILDMSKEPGEIYVLLQELLALPHEVYRDGVRVDISGASRENPALKQTTFISESSSQRKRLGGQIFEILLTHNGRILEGMTSNFFYVRDGELSTAKHGVLSGVTREAVLTIARQAGIRVRYKALTLREILEIDEAFITSSSRGVVPVVQIADQLVRNGKVGKTTKRLMNLYEQQISDIAEPII
ncbi:MAG TPA: aminotransferase class IV [Anaerolineales bacterium]